MEENGLGVDRLSKQDLERILDKIERLLDTDTRKQIEDSVREGGEWRKEFKDIPLWDWLLGELYEHFLRKLEGGADPEQKWYNGEEANPENGWGSKWKQIDI